MGGFSMRPTGEQNTSQAEVDRFLKEARESSGSGNPVVLGINQVQMMKAKRNGYPVDMYHEKFEMRQALKAEEEQALQLLGYQRQYIPKLYPKVLHRRNMDAKFEPTFEEGIGLQLTNSFVQSITVRDEKHEKEVRAMKTKPGVSIWYESLAELPEIEDGPTEDPKVTQARLEGEVAGLKAKLAEKTKAA
jgi:hypothetical protein